MDKKSSIFIFVLFVVIFTIFSGYIFFTNSSDLELKLQTHHENIRKHSATTTLLTKSLVNKDDSISMLIKKVDALNSYHKKDSVLINRKNTEIKKLLHQKDSLVKINHHTHTVSKHD